jgi:hypothetical protein
MNPKIPTPAAMSAAENGVLDEDRPERKNVNAITKEFKVLSIRNNPTERIA